jgi:hypothetical protein
MRRIVFSAALVGGLASSPAVAQSPSDTAALARLFNSPDHPLPIMPVAVPLAVSDQDVDKLLAPGNRPSVFQISRADGPDADPVKVLFFQEMAIEYLNAVNFRKVAFGSPAATHLYHDLTKPVYIIVDPAKQGADRAVVFDEGGLYEEAVKSHGPQVESSVWSVTQKTLEGVIYEKLRVSPKMLTPFPLTTDNAQRVVFDTQPVSQEPTAKWVSVYFYPDAPKWAAEVNRIRVMLFMESFFFPGRMRELDCNLTSQGSVYQTLLQKTPPDAPELWVINPDKHQGVKYMPGQDGPPLAELTHAAYVQWLAKNGVPAPPSMALNSEAVAQELRNVQEQQRKAGGQQ